MNAFVTGSTGLLGTNLVQALLERGHRVRALARNRAKAEKVLPRHPCLEIVEGDLENISGFGARLEGCEVLFNTAAYFRESFGLGDHWPVLERINITNTVALFTEAERMGVGRIVHTSSTASIAHRADGQPAAEQDLERPERAGDLYARSKILGDQAILGFGQSHAISVVTVHPSWMFGPSDTAPTAGGQFVLDYVNRKIPGILAQSGIAVVDVRDVVATMLAALNASSGSRFIASGHFASQAELCTALARVTDIPVPRSVLPNGLVVSIAWVSERLAALTKQPSLLTVTGVRAMNSGKRFSSLKAQRELGIVFRPLDETMRDSVAWFRQHGQLAPASPPRAA